MKYFHLSHIDLDGYSAQFVASCFVDEIAFYNSNYGDEITVRIDEIFADMIAERSTSAEPFMVLVSDLNLTLEQCAYIEKKIYDIEHTSVILLDHHSSGLDSSEAYDWYFLDTTRCATKLVYEYFLKQQPAKKFQEHLPVYVELVNAVDMWFENDEWFELGKVCMQMIAKANEVPKHMFANADFEYKYHLIGESMKFLGEKDSHIKLDEQVYFLKKSYLANGRGNDTFDNISSLYIVELIEKNQPSLSIEFRGLKAVVTYKLFHISILANLFLKRNPDVDFFVNVSARGHLSFRADNKADVSQLASDYFGGGGHKNASGGSISDFKGSFDYAQIKRQFVAKLSG